MGGSVLSNLHPINNNAVASASHNALSGISGAAIVPSENH